MADKQVGVRLQVIGGGKVKTEFAQIGKTGTGALDNVTKASRRSGFALQNAAFQVGDFFVQVNSGQSAVRAMAQQLPQLLGSFGLFGALAGAGAAALVPLVSSMFEGEDAADELDEMLKELAESTNAYKEAAEASRVSIADLITEYGELADEIERVRDIKEELRRGESEDDLNATKRSLAGQALGGFTIGSRDSLAALDGGLDALIAKSEVLRDELASVEPFSKAEESLRRQIEEVDAYIATLQGVEDSVDGLADKYGISAEAAKLIADEAIRLREAGSIVESAEAAEALSDALIEAFGSADAVKKALPDILDGLGDIVERAGDLNSELGLSKDLVNDILKALDKADENMKDAVGNLTPFGLGTTARRRPKRAPISEDLQTETRRRRTGGGGQSEAEKENQRLLRESKRIIDDVRTATEKYTAAEKDLNEMKRLGFINQETYNRELEKLKDELTGLGSFAKDAASAVRTAFDGLFDDPIAALEDLGKRLLQLALYQQLALAFPKAFGAGGVIPLPSFDGGGFTGGGSRIGGLDGKGGFLSMLHPNETVVDHTKGGAGGTSVEIHNYGGETARAERSRGPDGRELVRVIVGEEMARGSFDKPMAGRFRTTPKPVKR